jgi:Protein of unknown function (DUF3014)
MINKPVVGVAVLVLALAAGGVYYLRSVKPPVPLTPASPVIQESAGEPAIAHPVPDATDASAARAPLPPLADSDVALRDALAKVAGAEAVRDYLQPEEVVRRLVVTIDNLPRQKVAVEKRPTLGLASAFVVDGDELHATLDRRNFDRYKPMVAVVGKLDMQRLAQVYIQFYPLFQQAYQNLGYPSGYFNDRLVQVIDLLLATPQPTGPIELVRPNVMYTFADPALEALPAGQKLLIRMGPDNAALIKAKLSELRAAVTAASLKH